MRTARTGSSILTGPVMPSWTRSTVEGFDFFSPVGYDKIWREGKKVLMNILDIEVPMIAALNGPVLLHSEYALLCDIVLATPRDRVPRQAAFRLRHRAR